MDTIKALVTKPEENILSESVEGQDVTKEYTDLKSRLSNAEKTEKKLTEIMEDATKTEDVLAVYNQLIQVQEQIEILKGQIQYYEEASSLSSIQVTLRSEASIVPITIGGWKPQGIARDAVQALIDTLKGIANVTIWLVIFCLPISILITIPGYFIFKTFRKWQAKRKAKKAAADSNKE
jgi:hypothetical protein